MPVHTRIRPFNTRDTYPNQRLDNDLAQVVVARGTMVFVRGQVGQDLATSTSVGIGDPIPANVTFVPGSIRSGINCGSATTVEDDDASDSGEPDAITASVTGTNLAATTASLGPSASFAIAFNATVN